MTLTGLHHVSAITAHIADNKRFYTETLGMRLVKRSVNQDDVRAYHLFYADAVGSAGTDLTFFDYAGARRETPGTRSVTRTGLRVSGEASLRFWAQRLAAAGVPHGPVHERDGRLTLDFEDGEGQRLALVDDGGLGDAPAVWDASPVPAEHQIRGLGPVVMSVPDLEPTDLMLRAVLNMRAARTYPNPDVPALAVHVYEMGDAGQGGAHAELHVAVEPDRALVRAGAGGVHHVAFRTPDEAQYHAWAARLTEFGLAHSGEVDRHYFRSLYVREPGGILFEIATDGPGFAVDEDEATLGETVVLPPFLEARRAEILAGLTPIG